MTPLVRTVVEGANSQVDDISPVNTEQTSTTKLTEGEQDNNLEDSEKSTKLDIILEIHTLKQRLEELENIAASSIKHNRREQNEGQTPENTLSALSDPLDKEQNIKRMTDQAFIASVCLPLEIEGDCKTPNPRKPSESSFQRNPAPVEQSEDIQGAAAKVSDGFHKEEYYNYIENRVQIDYDHDEALYRARIDLIGSLREGSAADQDETSVSHSLEMSGHPSRYEFPVEDKASEAVGQQTSNHRPTIQGDTNLHPHPNQPLIQDSLQLFRWNDFRADRTCQDQDQITRHVIEVLVEDPIHGVPPSPDDDLPPDNLWYRDNLRLPPPEAELPERIRIRSYALCKILCHKDFIPDPIESPLVLTRPFGQLFYQENALRGLYKRLTAKFHVSISQDDGQPTGSCASLDEDDEDDEDDSFCTGSVPDGDLDEWHTRDLVHLHLLLGFMDASPCARSAYLKSEACKSVFFSDLWLLFQPGELIFDQDEKQAYQIVQVRTKDQRNKPPQLQTQHASDQTQQYFTPHALQQAEYRRLQAEQKRRMESQVMEKRALMMALQGRRRSGRQQYRPRPYQPVQEDCVSFGIVAANVAFDGTKFGPLYKDIRIPEFVGAKAVTSLEVYPIRYAWSPNPRTELLARGRLVLELANPKHVHYKGPTCTSGDDIDSQVMIDFEEYYAAEDNEDNMEGRPKFKPGEFTVSESYYQYENSYRPCVYRCCSGEVWLTDSMADYARFTEFVEEQSQRPDWGLRSSLAVAARSFEDIETYPWTLTEEEIMILPDRVFGFVLRSRKWETLDPTYVMPIDDGNQNYDVTGGTGDNTEGERTKQAKSPFDQLVIPDEHKLAILSLVSQHFRDKNRERQTDNAIRDNWVDIVRGKGKGLILLLHGAPGVGKTSTAECVADLFQKPLYHITCSDLGTEAKAVEQTLEKTFSRAHKWDCVLLLDEADVFLAKRSVDNFVRNSLVSVFLRVLEYYAGILFLTTNRVGDFDEAFRSRIHFSLFYQPLSFDYTWKIFKNNLDRIRDHFEAKNWKLDVELDKIAIFVSEYFHQNEHSRWNGRQIRNACQTTL